MTIRQRIQKLQKMCVNYQERKDSCLVHGNCVISQLKHDEDSLVKGIFCCKWFHSAVLPNDPGLINSINDMDAAKRSKSKVCKFCKNEFIPNSNRQMFCEECGKINRKQHKALSERNRRNINQNKPE